MAWLLDFVNTGARDAEGSRVLSTSRTQANAIKKERRELGETAST
jgi:hypothetical protein